MWEEKFYQIDWKQITGREAVKKYRKLAREIFFRRQNGKCYYCKGDMVLDGCVGGVKQPNSCTYEHIYRPTDVRWQHIAMTDVAACDYCNRTRSIYHKNSYWGA
jgi:hypothetical protein